MKTVWIAAGGTAGHINSAIVIGDELSEKGFQIKYISGQRDIDYKILKDKSAIHLCSKALVGRNIFKIIGSLFWNLIAFFKMLFKPSPIYAIGCGGFVCGPTLLAAKIKGKKIFILEQNSVMGFTNKVLSKIADKIFISFPRTIGLKETYRSKSVLVGNPIRKEIVYSKMREDKKELRILIFGGSLGAEEINNLVKSILNKKLNFQAEIIHQVGKDKRFDVIENPGIKYSQFEYLDNIPELYSWCDCIVSRAGASTISELLIVKKPSFLIPALYHSDKHQVHNAQYLLAKSPYSEISLKESEHEEKILGFFDRVFENEKRHIDEIKQDRSEELISQFLLDLEN